MQAGKPGGAAIIAIAHHAGGVGKTTTTLNLGYSLAATGRRTLLVDLDPQADLSERLNLAPDAPTLAGVLTGRDRGTPAGLSCRWEGMPGTLDVIPGALEEMSDVEMLLITLPMREQRLVRALAPFHDTYDVILLDCPPSLTMLTTNALWAANWVLVPVQAQDKALRQLPKILGTLAGVQEFREGLPALLGLLLTMADRREAMAGEVEAQLRTAYGEAVFQTVIPRRTKIAEDARWTAPLAIYAPNGAAAGYDTLAQEVIARAIP